MKGVRGFLRKMVAHARFPILTSRSVREHVYSPPCANSMCVFAIVIVVCNVTAMQEYIYRIKHKHSDKSYVGRTKDYEKRWRQHYKKRPKSKISYIHNALRKHGRDAFDFEVLAVCDTDDAGGLEDYYIRWYNGIAPKGYNLISPGETSMETLRRKREGHVKTRAANLVRKYDRQDDLPRFVYKIRKAGVDQGYAVRVPGQKSWSIESKRLSMATKLRTALCQHGALLNGEEIDRKKVSKNPVNDTLPKYMHYDSYNRYYTVHDKAHPKRNFLTKELALAYLDGMSRT